MLYKKFHVKLYPKRYLVPTTTLMPRYELKLFQIDAVLTRVAQGAKRYTFLSAYTW
jgi:hypothetical protein